MKILYSVLASSLAFGQSSESIKKDLASLYPHLTKAQLAEKIHNTSDAFHFVRSFVPYFYEVLRHESLDLPLDAGWGLGDAHIENFGSLIDKNGRAHLRMNDKDDAGPCPLSFDFLRFLISIAMADKNFNLNAAVKSYTAGLQGLDESFSSVTKTFLADAEKQGAKPSSRALEDEQHLKRVEDSFELSKIERDLVDSTLKNIYGSKIESRDAVGLIPKNGGSSHLLRYRVLVHFEKDSPFLVDPEFRDQIIEFKTLIRPGIFPVATSEIPDEKARLQKSLDIEEGIEASKLYAVQKVGNRWMLIRPRFDGNNSISMSDYSSAKIKDLILDEAFVLGKLHSKSAPASYLPHVLATTKDQWVKATDLMVQKLEQAYTILQNDSQSRAPSK